MSVRIEDHAMLGNCRSAALVDHEGTIDWLRLPRFDSNAVFAALLGEERHGCWKLAPVGAYKSRRAYRDGVHCDGLVERYRADASADGLPPGEGSFIACSFRLAENYALLGRVEQARTLFERLLGLCNDVGLLGEEYDPRSGRTPGNFPQGYSHVALVNAALRLHRLQGHQETSS